MPFYQHVIARVGMCVPHKTDGTVPGVGAVQEGD